MPFGSNYPNTEWIILFALMVDLQNTFHKSFAIEDASGSKGRSFIWSGFKIDLKNIVKCFWKLWKTEWEFIWDDWGSEIYSWLELGVIFYFEKIIGKQFYLLSV